MATRSHLQSSGGALRTARAVALLAALTLAGCAVFEPKPAPVPAAVVPPAPVADAPLATHVFAFDPKHDGVVGELQATVARHEDTFPDLARRFNVGFEELRRANPGVDPWLPGEGTRIVLPTQYVLPDAPFEGLVINVAALRMFYFPKARAGEPRRVFTHPIGIGKVGWATPLGQTTIASKRANPWWTPPESVRREHAEAGDPLPARVPPGPDNPLGAHAMNLGWPSYLMHGTNKPAGVGLRASHGCIRLYPEDIAALYDKVPLGTKVRVVNQAVAARWHHDRLYVQAYPPLEEDKAKHAKPKPGKGPTPTDALLAKLFQVAKHHGATVDSELTAQLLADHSGVAVPVSQSGLTLQQFLADARLVENEVPAGSNWDGGEAVATADAGTSAGAH
jgi:L,D-transpeptidase ErfK/SrfK